jgi:hypothetical protein
MEKNVGKADKIVRVIIGLVSLYLAFKFSMWWLVLAVIAFGTALRGSCLLYSLLGISTAEKKKEIKPVKKSKKK